MRHFLDFEKPVAELERTIEELRRAQEPGGINIEDEVERLTDKADKQLRLTYASSPPGRRPRSPATRSARTRWTT